MVVARGGIEISPPFLPVRDLSVFRSNDIRRTYLSATLKSESEFIRAYGRAPGLRIEPEVDAGNGERTIISARGLSDSTQIIPWAAAKKAATKVLVAVPSRRESEAWLSIAKPPNREEFTSALESFRRATKGGFVLAGRFDGIDLPDTSCRMMIISGLPAGGSMLETYLWQVLELQNLLSARVATRVIQLFGRIIRGRNDYGVFLIQATALLNWLSRDRNLALLPDLLQKQLKLGQHLQEDFGVDELKVVDEFLPQIWERDPDWLDYYRRYLDAHPLEQRDIEKRAANERAQREAALAETRFAEAMWQGRYADAISILQPVADQVAATDSKLAGWLNLWLGAAHQVNGSAGAEEQFRIARARLPLHMTLPLEPLDRTELAAGGRYGSDRALREMVAAGQRAFEKRRAALSEIANGLAQGTTFNQHEEAFRQAGTVFGYDSSRPDSDTGAGPDVLWIDDDEKKAITFELKTEKNHGSELSKKEVGQSHNHMQWVADNCQSLQHIAHFIVGDELIYAENANPNPEWRITTSGKLLAVVGAFVEFADSIRRFKVEQIGRALQQSSDARDWATEAIAERLAVKRS